MKFLHRKIQINFGICLCTIHQSSSNEQRAQSGNAPRRTFPGLPGRRHSQPNPTRFIYPTINRSNKSSSTLEAMPNDHDHEQQLSSLKVGSLSKFHLAVGTFNQRQYPVHNSQVATYPLTCLPSLSSWSPFLVYRFDVLRGCTRRLTNLWTSPLLASCRARCQCSKVELNSLESAKQLNWSV